MKKVTRRRLLQGSGAAIAGLALGGCRDSHQAESIHNTPLGSPGTSGSPNPSGQPNIVLIIADDLGFSDLGCFGSEIATPNLDKLAAGGTKFTNMHNNPRCCPSRATLLSGLYPTQTGVGYMTGDQGTPAYQGYLNRFCVTMAEALAPPATARPYPANGTWPPNPASTTGPPTVGSSARTARWGGGYFRPSLYQDGASIGTVDQSGLLPDDRHHEHRHRVHREVRRRRRPVLHVRPVQESALSRFRRPRRHRALPRQLLHGLGRAALPALGSDPGRQGGRPGMEAAEPDRRHRAVEPASASGLAGVEDGGLRRPGHVDGPRDRADPRLAGPARDPRQHLVLFLADNGACAEVVQVKDQATLQSAHRERSADDRRQHPRRLSQGRATPIQSYGVEWANASDTPFPKVQALGGGGRHLDAAHRLLAGDDPGGRHRQPVPPHHRPDADVPRAGERDLSGLLRRTRAHPAAGPQLRLCVAQPARLRRLAATGICFWEHMGHRAALVGRWKIVANKPVGAVQALSTWRPTARRSRTSASTIRSSPSSWARHGRSGRPAQESAPGTTEQIPTT